MAVFRWELSAAERDEFRRLLHMHYSAQHSYDDELASEILDDIRSMKGFPIEADIDRDEITIVPSDPILVDQHGKRLQ